MSKKRATIRQKRAFKGFVTELKKEKPRPMSVVFKEAGYGARLSKAPARIINSQGFQLLLAKVDDDEIIQRVVEIMRDEDKRSSLTAADMLFKLKGRYPKEQIDIEVSQKRESLFINNDASNVVQEEKETHICEVHKIEMPRSVGWYGEKWECPQCLHENHCPNGKLNEHDIRPETTGDNPVEAEPPTAPDSGGSEQ